MEDQYIPITMGEMTKKRKRCNTATWLQIFGGTGVIGGIITAAVTGGFWPIIGGSFVALGSFGVFVFGCYKDRHSCLKCCCGTSFQEDINFENAVREGKFKERNEVTKRFIDEIDENTNQNQTIDHDVLVLLNAIEENLYQQNTASGRSLLTRIQDLKTKLGIYEPLIENDDKPNVINL